MKWTCLPCASARTFARRPSRGAFVRACDAAERFFDAAPPITNPGRLEAAEAALARVAGGLRAEVRCRRAAAVRAGLVFRHDAAERRASRRPPAGLVVGEGSGRRGADCGVSKVLFF